MDTDTGLNRPGQFRGNTVRNMLFTSTVQPGAGPNAAEWLAAPAVGDVTKVPPASTMTMSVAVLTLIVVASLCAVVGAIYMLIYFKSIKPMTARARSYKDGAGGAKSDDDGSRSKSAHPFFRRK